MTEGVGRVLVDATTEDPLDIDSSGRAAIQDQPSMDVALSTRAAEAGGNLETLAGVDFATEAKQDVIVGHVDNVETLITALNTLVAAIKNTDGVKRIADPLPAGTNEIGKVAQGTKAAAADAWPIVPVDASGNPQLIQPDTTIPANTPITVLAGEDAAGKSQYVSARANVDEEDQAIKALTVEGPWDFLYTGSIDALDETVAAKCNGRGTVGICITGTWTGRIEFEASINEINWCPVLGYPVNAEGLVSDHTTENGTWRVPSSGFKSVRVRASEWTTGTATINLRASPVQINTLSLDASGAINVIVSAPASPRLVNPYYNKSDGALVANTFKRVMTYTVPSGYTAYLIRYTSWQNEAAYSRVVDVKDMGSFNFDPDTYTAGDSYETPLWASTVEAEITTQIGSTGSDRTVTVTYTNESGTSGRTGTFTVPKSSIVGRRFVMTKQVGDLGVSSIQDISSDLTGDVGVMDIIGFVNLAFHDDLSATVPTETNYSAGAVTFKAGTVVGFEYSGSAVAKQRILEALLQLVEAVE